MYMSYCRFEGTKAELNACLAVAEEHANDEAEYKVSQREIENFEDLIRTFHAFLIDYEILDEAGSIDEAALEGLLYKMSQAAEEEA